MSGSESSGGGSDAGAAASGGEEAAAVPKKAALPWGLRKEALARSSLAVRGWGGIRPSSLSVHASSEEAVRRSPVLLLRLPVT